jgi:hypothetical protein
MPNENPEIENQGTPAPEVTDPTPDSVVEDTAISNQLTEGDKTAAATKEPEYTPNYKFKVLDQEKEFDEWIRTAVNKDNEAKVRELYEKAHGLDHVKTQRDQEKTRAGTLESKLNQLVQEFSEVHGLHEKDFGLFLDKLKIPRQVAAQWLMKELEAQEAETKLPESMRGMYNQNKELSKRLYDMEQAFEKLSTSRSTETVSARRSDLQSVLSRPDIKSFVDQYDARLGKPGSFEQMVARHGSAEWEASQGQTDLTAEQAVTAVLSMLGHTPTPPSQAAPQAGGSTQPPKVITQAKPTVIPNVGRGVSAPTAGKRPKNLTELRALSKAMSGG